MEKAMKCTMVWGMMVLAASIMAVLIFATPMQASAAETSGLTAGSTVVGTQSSAKKTSLPKEAKSAA